MKALKIIVITGMILAQLLMTVGADFAADQAAQAKTYYTQANKLYDQEKYKEAMVLVDKSLKLNAKDALANELKGLVYYRLNKNQEALTCINKAISLNKRNPEFYMIKGWICEKLNDFSGGLKSYNKAVVIEPNYYGSVFGCSWDEKSRSVRNNFLEFEVNLPKEYELWHMEVPDLVVAESKNYGDVLTHADEIMEKVTTQGYSLMLLQSVDGNSILHICMQTFGEDERYANSNDLAKVVLYANKTVSDCSEFTAIQQTTIGGMKASYFDYTLKSNSEGTSGSESKTIRVRKYLINRGKIAEVITLNANDTTGLTKLESDILSQYEE